MNLTYKRAAINDIKKTNETGKKSNSLLIWSILNLVLPVPLFVSSGLFETMAFFTFITKDGIVRPERKFLDDILMLPLYVTSIGILVSCILSIVFSIKKRKNCDVASCIAFSTVGFLIEIFLWCGITYIGSNF